MAAHPWPPATLPGLWVIADYNPRLGGQIGQEHPRLFHLYPEGNFIEATDDTPFFQIGEHKYGKPIIDRVAPAAGSMVWGT